MAFNPSHNIRAAHIGFFLLLLTSIWGCTVNKRIHLFRYHSGIKARIYYPTAEGSVWTYLAQTWHRGTYFTHNVIHRITRQVGHEFFFENALGNKFSIIDSRDGLLFAHPRNYFLKEPIVKGGHWPLSIPWNGRAEILTVKKVLKIPAGTFHNCVMVSLKGRNVRAQYTFSPHVGLIHRKIFMKALGKWYLTSRIVLQGYRIGKGAPHNI